MYCVKLKYKPVEGPARAKDQKNYGQMLPGKVPRRMHPGELISKVKLVIFIIMEWNVPEMA